MKYNYKIDTRLLPKVWLTWWTADNKQHWLNCQTGKRKDNPDKTTNTYVGLSWRTMQENTITVKSGSSLKYMYVKYHQDIDMLEMAAVGMKTTRAAEIKNWEYIGDRFFMNRDKVIFDQDGNIPNRYHVHEWHDAWNGNVLFSTLLRLNYNTNNITNEFKKFIGASCFVIGNGRSVSVDYAWHLQFWYKTSQKPRGKGKEQKLADRLTEIPLGDTTGFAEKYPVEILDTGGYYNKEIRHIMYYERLTDGWRVLRQFNRNRDNQITEVSRVYLNDSGKSRIVAPSTNGWIISTKVKSSYYTSYQLVNKDEAMAQCPRLKYIIEALSFVERENMADALITTLKFPEIEQFSKLGYTRAAKCMLGNTTPKADIKRFFGDYYNDKEKSILKKVGMTKRQLDCFMAEIDNSDAQRSYYTSHVQRGLKDLRDTFGNDLSYMDYESFQRYLKGFSLINNNFWSGIDYYINHLGVDKIKFVKNLIRLGEKRQEIYGVMKDTINMYSGLNRGTEPEVDWYFDDCSDVVRFHDAVMALKHEQDAERRAMYNMAEADRRKKEEEKRKKLDKERKQYEYEDDDYLIRLPNDPSEIVREGSMQHICIGGYVSSHSTGATNLFFLRKKNEPELPFYAIEMSNTKNIVQIHGFGNKWLGNDPEAIPTVVRWLRKNDIKCDDKILTCKARGYGRTNDYVSMPVVD